jgi:S-adenosylmethionine decarboxylase
MIAAAPDQPCGILEGAPRAAYVTVSARVPIEEPGMRQNAPLRSGRRPDLPGHARKRRVAAPDAAERRDAFVTRNGTRCAGVHLIIDLFGASRLNDIDHIDNVLRRCAEAAGATLLHIHLHRFQPDGVSGVAVLAESHISIHTWPEEGYAALDVFMCGQTDPDRCVPILREAFAAKRVGVSELLRGQAG